MNFTIREIQKEDNPKLAFIIRNVLEEFKANHPGTVYYDETTDNLFQLFQKPDTIYYVALMDDEIVGGCGIYTTDGLPNNYCELVKLYLLPHARSYGIGKILMNKCFEFAKHKNFTHIYLESMPELTTALIMYKKLGFKIIQQRLGNACHFGCQIKMLKEVE
jgi:putative acetyltransferase